MSSTQATITYMIDMKTEIKFFNNLLNSTSFTKRWIVCCLLFAVTVQTLCHGVVLCFEEDGRIEIEFNSGADGKCCLPSNDKAVGSSFPILSRIESEDSCGLCIDVPLFIKAEKSNWAGFLTFGQLVSFLNVSQCLYDVFDCADTWKVLPPISLVVFHISTTQTVILQV